MNLTHIKKCIVHDNCPDGLVSAILLRDALPEAEIVFVAYGSEAYKALRPEPGVLYADFSPPVRTFRSTEGLSTGTYFVHAEDLGLLKAYVDAGTIVLDHHATARPVVEAFVENGRFGDEKANPGVCGATLVYEHVWLGNAARRLGSIAKPIINLVLLAGIRDTWQRSHDRWREACAQARVLMFYPKHHWVRPSRTERSDHGPGMSLDNILNEWPTYEALGEVLEQKNEERVTELIESAYSFTSRKGTRVAVVAGTDTSDVAEALDVDLVIGFAYSTERTYGAQLFHVTQTPKMRLSTRSHTTFDCAAFTKTLGGGGGHTKAAGCSRPVYLFDAAAWGLSMNPYSTIVDLVEEFEG